MYRQTLRDLPFPLANQQCDPFRSTAYRCLTLEVTNEPRRFLQPSNQLPPHYHQKPGRELTPCHTGCPEHYLQRKNTDRDLPKTLWADRYCTSHRVSNRIAPPLFHH